MQIVNSGQMNLSVLVGVLPVLFIFFRFVSTHVVKSSYQAASAWYKMTIMIIITCKIMGCAGSTAIL